MTVVNIKSHQTGSTLRMAAAIASALGEREKAALLAVPEEAWSKVPDRWTTLQLLTGHGIPLISVTGDWVKLTRIGLAVRRQLLCDEHFTPDDVVERAVSAAQRAAE